MKMIPIILVFAMGVSCGMDGGKKGSHKKEQPDKRNKKSGKKTRNAKKQPKQQENNPLSPACARNLPDSAFMLESATNVTETQYEMTNHELLTQMFNFMKVQFELQGNRLNKIEERLTKLEFSYNKIALYLDNLPASSKKEGSRFDFAQGSQHESTCDILAQKPLNNTFKKTNDNTNS